MQIETLFGVTIDAGLKAACVEGGRAYITEDHIAWAHSVDELSELEGSDIDEMLARFHSSISGSTSRARMALTILAWYTIFNPHASSPNFFMDATKLQAALEEDADSVYSFATRVTREPDIKVHTLLSSLDEKMAEKYFRHCAMMMYRADPVSETVVAVDGEPVEA
jgi:hypothetical protein